MQIIIDVQEDGAKIYAQAGFVPKASHIAHAIAALIEFTKAHDTRCSLSCQRCAASGDLFEAVDEVLTKANLFEHPLAN